VTEARSPNAVASGSSKSPASARAAGGA
jgi:hypothetical protein